MDILRISAIIVCINDGRHLSECLESLAYCDEILIFDMGSTDESVAIASKYATRIKSIARADYIEKIWGGLIKEASNDWIIFIDPDEVFPKDIFPYIDELTRKDNIGLFSIPWQYYFLGEPLHSTVWGEKNYKARVFHRKRANLSPKIFGGVVIKPGFKTYTFPYDKKLVIKHYWVDDIVEMFKKHWRYIRNEGQARYMNGNKFSVKLTVIDTYHALRKNLIDCRGLWDGWRGIFLSFFNAWYILFCHLSLLAYQILRAGDSERNLDA